MNTNPSPPARPHCQSHTSQSVNSHTLTIQSQRHIPRSITYLHTQDQYTPPTHTFPHLSSPSNDQHPTPALTPRSRPNNTKSPLSPPPSPPILSSHGLAVDLLVLQCIHVWFELTAHPPVNRNEWSLVVPTTDPQTEASTHLPPSVLLSRINFHSTT